MSVFPRASASQSVLSSPDPCSSLGACSSSFACCSMAVYDRDSIGRGLGDSLGGYDRILLLLTANSKGLYENPGDVFCGNLGRGRRIPCRSSCCSIDKSCGDI